MGKKKTFPQSKNTSYSRQLQTHVFHIFYNEPEISPCSKSSEGGPEKYIYIFFFFWPMLFPLVLYRSRLLGQCIHLMFCCYSGAQLKKSCCFSFLSYFFFHFSLLPQFVSLTLTLSHSVLWVSLT